MPPPPAAVAVPSLLPLHDTFTWLLVTVSTAGSVMVTVVAVVQPLLSVTVTVHAAAVNPVDVDVLCAGAGSFHMYV